MSTPSISTPSISKEEDKPKEETNYVFYFFLILFIIVMCIGIYILFSQKITGFRNNEAQIEDIKGGYYMYYPHL